MTSGAAADRVDDLVGHLRVVRERRHRQADAIAGEQLQATRSLSRERPIATDSLSG